MLAIAAVILLTAMNPAESSELELVLEEGMESDLQTDELVLDDSVVSEEDCELMGLEE